MRFELVQNTGDCIEAYDCRDAALEVLIERITDDPSLAEELAILEFDDESGSAVAYIEVDPELLVIS